MCCLFLCITLLSILMYYITIYYKNSQQADKINPLVHQKQALQNLWRNKNPRFTRITTE